jgi:hypothetical protein
MRPLRYSINVTLDGCCDHRAMFPDEALHRHTVENLNQALGPEPLDWAPAPGPDKAQLPTPGPVAALQAGNFTPGRSVDIDKL